MIETFIITVLGMAVGGAVVGVVTARVTRKYYHIDKLHNLEGRIIALETVNKERKINGQPIIYTMIKKENGETILIPKD